MNKKSCCSTLTSSQNYFCEENITKFFKRLKKYIYYTTETSSGPPSSLSQTSTVKMAKSKSAITVNKNIKSKYFKKTKNDKTTRVGKTAKIRTRSWKKQTVKSLPNPGNLGTSNSNESILVNPLEFKRLSFDFFDSSTEKLAIDLLGKVLCRKTKQGEILCGIIVETEAYLGINDPACHSYGGRRTSRNAPMYKPSGTSYVYFIYGMYYCLNISSADEGACVLIRALDPLCGKLIWFP